MGQKELDTPKTNWLKRLRGIRLSRNRKIAAWLGAVLLVLFTLAIIVMFAGSGVKPTGDPLFDRYAEEVGKRIATGEYSLNALSSKYNFGSKEFAAALPDETLEEWEAEFGDDPRYWELRFLYADNGSGFSISAAAQGVKQPEDFLRIAIERGVASGNTHLLLYDVERYKLDKQLDALPYYSTRAEYSQQEIALCIREHARIEAEELALLNAAIDADPELAWGYYWRAMYWFDLGELELGLADLQAGNAVPNGTYQFPFPLDFVQQEVQAGRAPGSKVVCGAVMESVIGWPMPNYLRLKEAMNNTRAACKLGMDYAPAFNAWAGFARRLGQEGETLIGSLVAIVLTGLMDNWLLVDHGTELSSEQQYALEQYRAAGKAIKERIVADSDSFDLWEDIPRRVLFNPLCGKFISYYLELQNNQQSIRGISLIFDDMLKLDYATLELPPELEDYKLSAEQLERDAKREQRKLDAAAQEQAWNEEYQAEKAAREAAEDEGAAN